MNELAEKINGNKISLVPDFDEAGVIVGWMAIRDSERNWFAYGLTARDAVDRLISMELDDLPPVYQSPIYKIVKTKFYKDGNHKAISFPDY
jgi:hypothetical protein